MANNLTSSLILDTIGKRSLTYLGNILAPFAAFSTDFSTESFTQGQNVRIPVATVGALIHDGNGHVLMVRTHKWGDRWGIPGGKIERGESSTDALRREIREETGLELREIEFALVQDCIDSPEFQRPEHFLLLNYVARATSTAVELNDEAEEFRWLSPADALALNLNQPTRFLLMEALDRDLISHVSA